LTRLEVKCILYDMKTIQTRIYPVDLELVKAEVARCRRDEKYQPPMPVIADILHEVIDEKYGRKENEVDFHGQKD
jgi:hypothetical protein